MVHEENKVYTPAEIKAIVEAFEEYCGQGWSPGCFIKHRTCNQGLFYRLVRVNTRFRKTYLDHAKPVGKLYYEMYLLHYGTEYVREKRKVYKKRPIEIVKELEAKIKKDTVKVYDLPIGNHQKPTATSK